MSKALLVVALVLAFIATLLGFGIIKTDGDPHVLGWIGATLLAYIASLLAPT